ncbi:MAG: Gfo/Idh/MocA family protein [Brevinema sp.]
MTIIDRKLFNIGVVGVGHMGQYHVNLLTKIIPNNHVFIYDLNLEQSHKVAKEYNVECCESYEQLLSKVEAVIVVIPTYLHYEYVMAALKKGLHVLVEKPISNNLAHAQEMTAYAQEHNLTLHIGHVERFNGAVQAIRDCIDEPFYFQTQRIGSVSRIQDVGVVLDLMIHDIDLVLSFVNAPVVEVSAYGNSVVTPFEDYALATLYFENGAVASLTASRVSCYKARSMTISQKNSHIYLDYATNDLLVYRNQDVHYNVSQEQITYTEGHMIDRVFIHKDNPLKLELEYFIDDINGDISDGRYKHILWDSHSNLYTMEVAFMILKEIEKRKKS